MNKHLRWVGRVAFAVLLLSGWSAGSFGADPAFVGKLALLADPAVADELALSEEVRKQLAELIDQREEKATEEVLKLKGLPPQEQARMMAPFVADSEKLGLALLTDDQRDGLEKIRLQREGMATLADPQIAVMLNLTDDQKAQVKTLLEERAVETAKGGEEERRVARAASERKLAAVLTKTQRIAWDVMVGLAPEAALAEAGKEETPAKAAGEPGAAQPDEAPAARTAPPPEVAADGSVKLRFNFAHQPWKDVLDWFAEQAKFSLVANAMPEGTFNYTDTMRAFTPAEAIDLLNSVLLTKGYTLVQREKMLILINLEDEIPPALIERVSLDELDRRGEYTLVSCLFDLKKLTPEAAKEEIKDLVGPQGKITVLPSSRKIIVQETAGNLRTIRQVLLAADGASAELRVFDLKSVLADDVLNIARQIFNIPEGEFRAADGALNLAVDPLGTRIFASGNRDKLDRLNEILEAVDEEVTELDPRTPAPEAPVLSVYPVGVADPQSVLQVIQHLLAGQPEVNVASDPGTGNLILLARPPHHRTVKATIAEMQGGADKAEVIKLQRADVQATVSMINKLFGGSDDKEKAAAPKVDGNSADRLLFVRGSDEQIQQIKALVDQIDKDLLSPADPLFTSGGGSIRMLPLTGRNARAALEQAQFMWGRPNTIRIRSTGSPGGDGRTPAGLGARPGAGFDEGMADQGPESFVFPRDAQDGGEEFQAQPRERPQMERPPAAAQPPARRFNRDLPRGLPRELLDESTRSRRRATQSPAAATPAIKGSDKTTAADPAREEIEGGKLVFVSETAESEGEAPSQPQADEAAPAEQPAVKPAAESDPPAEAPANEPAAPEAETPQDEPADAQALPAEPSPIETPLPEGGSSFRSRREAESPADAGEPAADQPGAEIDVLITPQGIIIRSDDKQALDEFQRLLNQLMADMSVAGGDQIVFYLKYARADYAAEVLKEILSGTTSSSSSSGGGLGDLANLLGGGGLGGGLGGMMGALLGGGGGGGSSGGTTVTKQGTSVTITPETRLNALIVQAEPADVARIEGLLEIIDQESGPEPVELRGKPELIPVMYTTADEVAAIVREVYADRLVSSSSGGGGGRGGGGNPQDFIRMIQQSARGGGRGRNTMEDQQKMTLGVDARSNSLIVSAPQWLFEEVQNLVRTLDTRGEDSNQAIQVVTLSRGSADLVGRTITSVVGANATSNSAMTNNNNNRNRTNQRGQFPGQGAQGFQWGQFGQFGGGNRGGFQGFQGGGNRGGFQGGFGGGGNRGGFGQGGGNRGGGNRGGGNRGGGR
jgi:type II secretory pathway component GspD/PulD (secretin)